MMNAPLPLTLEDLRWMSDCAMRTLIATGQASPGDFQLASGDETISARPGLIHRNSGHKRLHAYAEPLPGTPLYWTIDYYGEGDCQPAIDFLEEIEFWENFDYESYEASR